VHLTNFHPPLKIWSCYIPSNSNVSSNLWQEFFNLISPNTLLGNDFNIGPSIPLGAPSLHPAAILRYMIALTHQAFVLSTMVVLLMLAAPTQSTLQLIYLSVPQISYGTYHGKFSKNLTVLTISPLL